MKPRRFWGGVAVLLALGLFLPHWIPKPPLKRGVALSHAVYDRNGRLLRLTVSRDEKYRLWIPLKDFAPSLVEATLLKEDRYFWVHPGVNPVSLLRAFWNTVVRKSFRMGGSTLTMQLARLRYGLRTRTFPGKLKQILKALQLEIFYTKRELLEAYLNIAPYGGNVEGAAAAGLIYFQKDPLNLSVPEALTLAVIPQRPERIAGEGLPEAFGLLLEAWLKRHPEEREKAGLYALPLITRERSGLPFEAPHFVDRLIADYPEESVLRTTLDRETQNLLERQIEKFIARKKNIGIQNACALLLRHEDMDVVGYVGSAGYWAEGIDGQVNGVKAPRSPGSTLKPFVYGLAMEQGLIHPQTMMKDSPFSLGAFNPENFDGDFAGPISARKALVKSRNIPAVHLSNMISKPDLYEFLWDAGVDIPYPKDHYGIAFVLGGMEVTMEDLGRLYALLANGGRWAPLRFLTSDPRERVPTALSPEASFLVLDILKDNPPPDRYYPSQWRLDDFPVPWKTGTSYAFRDAWSVGLFGPYVLAVWVGNFNGVGNPAFVGSQAAGPLFFEIVDALKSVDREMPPLHGLEAPQVSQVEVCALSGDLPGDHCPNVVKTWFIPGKSPIGKCRTHREVRIDNASRMRGCAELDRPFHTEVYEFWPSDLLKIFRLAGVPRRIPPPFHPDCPDDRQDAQGLPPKITTPKKGVIYNFRLGGGEKDRIPLAAVTEADVKDLYWFINRDYFAKAGGGEVLFWRPEPGAYLVRVVDDQGRSDSVNVVVNAVP